MSSYVAGVVSLVESSLGPPLVGSISPPPVPPNAVFPYTTVHQIGNTLIQNLLGSSQLCQTVIQINVWDPDYELAFALRRRVQNMLLPFVGLTLGMTIQGINHVYDHELYNGPLELHQLIARYGIWWEQDDV